MLKRVIFSTTNVCKWFSAFKKQKRRIRYGVQHFIDYQEA